ncbi:recombinase family protein [Sulfitobacter aestuarii]|uniref:Recombinase family protein n=1 Tax=Sulfitobacter aestuarii TaxID=2161676 RepID=A0ABW5U742_9RHOB
MNIQHSTPMAPLRARMIADMSARNLGTASQTSHLRACKRFAAWLGRSPETATPDDLRDFQRHLIESGTSICTRNQTMTGVKFLLRVTLRRHDLAAEVFHLKEPVKVPLVLSRNEVKRLLAMAPGLKARVMLSLAYGCGMRAGEVVRLKVGDIDGEQKIIRIVQAKGRKDRNVILPADIRVVQALLGQTNLKTTEIYVRASGQTLRQTLERLDVLSELWHPAHCRPSTDLFVAAVGADGMPVTGERGVLADEAAIVRRIFDEFSEGYPPKAIACRLNDEAIPGPRGGIWCDTTIRGHRTRGTGVLNNELYIGRLVWNRLRYIKDPVTGKRVSRLNPEQDWVIHEVPELRIVSDALWAAVKERQAQIDATPAVQGIKKSRFWEKRRGPHLLTGKLVCGRCGGTLASVGKDYLACPNARKRGTCETSQSFRRPVLEEAVLELLRERLMQPDAVAAFVSAFTNAANAERFAASSTRQKTAKMLMQTTDKLRGLYDAIADGLRTPGLLQQLEELEAQKAALEAQLEAPAPDPVRLHPGLAELYRKKVMELSDSLKDEAIRTPALDLLRSLIARVTVQQGSGDGVTVIELEGAIAAMVDQAQPGGLDRSDHGSVKVVAGARFGHCFVKLFKSQIVR